MANNHIETYLIADDDLAIAEGLAILLESADRKVIVCNDVHAAEIVIESMNVDAVISDIQFSGRFGFEGLRLLDHATKFRPEAKVILMTGQTALGLRDEAINRGGLALLEKPFDPEVLEALLHQSAA